MATALFRRRRAPREVVTDTLSAATPATATPATATPASEDPASGSAWDPITPAELWARPGWTELAPPEPVLSSFPFTVEREFLPYLPTRRPPHQMLSDMGHAVSPLAPSGVVEGLLELSISPAAPQNGRRGAPDLPLVTMAGDGVAEPVRWVRTWDARPVFGGTSQAPTATAAFGPEQPAPRPSAPAEVPEVPVVREESLPLALVRAERPAEAQRAPLVAEPFDPRFEPPPPPVAERPPEEPGAPAVAESFFEPLPPKDAPAADGTGQPEGDRDSTLPVASSSPAVPLAAPDPLIAPSNGQADRPLDRSRTTERSSRPSGEEGAVSRQLFPGGAFSEPDTSPGRGVEAVVAPSATPAEAPAQAPAEAPAEAGGVAEPAGAVLESLGGEADRATSAHSPVVPVETSLPEPAVPLELDTSQARRSDQSPPGDVDGAALMDASVHSPVVPVETSQPEPAARLELDTSQARRSDQLPPDDGDGAAVVELPPRQRRGRLGSPLREAPETAVAVPASGPGAGRPETDRRAAPAMPVVRPRHDGEADAALTDGSPSWVPVQALPGVIATSSVLPAFVDLPVDDAREAPVVVQVESGPIHWVLPDSEASVVEGEATVFATPPSARPATDLANAMSLAAPPEPIPAVPDELMPPVMHGVSPLPLPYLPTSDPTTRATEPGPPARVPQQQTPTPLAGGVIEERRSSIPARSPQAPTSPAGLLGGGPREVTRPLTPQLEVARSAVEQRTGVPLGDVPIHRDLVPGVAQRLGAQAYTDATGVHLPMEIGTGSSSRAGALLAHELTHAAQRKRFAGPLPAEHSGPGQHLETEARAAERAVAAQPFRPPGALFDPPPLDGWQPSRLTVADQATVPVRELPLAEPRPSSSVNTSSPFEGPGVRRGVPGNGSPTSMVLALPRDEPASSPGLQEMPLDRYLALTQESVAPSVGGAGPVVSPGQPATVTFPTPVTSAAQAPGAGGWAASTPNTGASGMQRRGDGESSLTGAPNLTDDHAIEQLLDQIFPSLTSRLRSELRRERDAWGQLTGLL